MANGIITYLTLGGQARRVHLVFSLAMFMGDGKSSDVLCCRRSHYKQARTSRACYTPFNDLVKLRDLDSRKIIVDCDWVYQNEQRILLVGCQADGKEKDSELLDRLNAVSTVRCDSAMFRLCYGGSPYGQFCTCTVDMMHAFEHGVVVYVLKAFVDEISGPKCKEMDRLAREMFADHRSSEKDTYPRANFTKGVKFETNEML